MRGALVLLSGGQDSTTCLYWARTMFDVVDTMAVDYGQRHRAELDAAAEVARMADARSHHVLGLNVLTELADSALVTSGSLHATGGYADAEMPEGLPTSFVPGRNAMLLTAAAGYAVKRGLKNIVTGVCQTDYSGYPDCRRAFVDAMERALTEAMPSSCGPIFIHTPLMDLNKAETVRLARRLPGCWEALGRTVTCYEGLRSGCGACPACELRSSGFKQAGYDDPASPHRIKSRVR